MYKKPEIIDVNDMSEGVYMTSGAAATSGVGTNVSWSFKEETPEHDGRPHWIRYYNTTITDVFNGGAAHCTFDFQGPIRHGGIKHQVEETVVRSDNHVECDILSCKPGAHDYRIYVCCDPEYYPDALNILSASIVPK